MPQEEGEHKALSESWSEKLERCRHSAGAGRLRVPFFRIRHVVNCQGFTGINRVGLGLHACEVLPRERDPRQRIEVLDKTSNAGLKMAAPPCPVLPLDARQAVSDPLYIPLYIVCSTRTHTLKTLILPVFCEFDYF